MNYGTNAALPQTVVWPAGRRGCRMRRTCWGMGMKPRDMMMRMPGKVRWTVPGLLILALAACGGGGGGGIRSTPTSAPPPATTPTTPQPPIDAQLSITNTYAAHDAGYTGQGVTIGFVDSGIMRSNPTVAGRVLQEYIDVDPNTNNTSIDDVVG